MSRFTTIRRRLLLSAGSVLLLSGLSLCVVHTGFVRSFVLVQIQTRLGNTQGLILEARGLDYNLLTSRFELKDVVVRGTGLAGFPPPLRAQRVVAIVPLWRLLRGSVDTARIQIDGLALQWITARDAHSNWPTLRFGGAGNAGGPGIQVTSGELIMRDDRTGLFLTLPQIRLNAAWNQGKREYAITLENSGGELRWHNSQVPLDRIQLRSALANGNLAVESLRILSGKSQAEIAGLLSGSASRLDASAKLDLDMFPLSDALSLAPPLQGRVQVSLAAGGPLDCVLVNADLQGQELAIRGIPIQRPSVQALFDTSTGELQIRSISAGLFAGQLSASGRIWTGEKQGRSEVTAQLNGLVPRRLAAAFGYARFPARPAGARVDASWPGLNWRLATISGAARTQSANISFKGAGSPGSMRATVDGGVGQGSSLHGEVALRLADQAMTGVVRGKIGSLQTFAGGLEQLMERSAGSVLGVPVDGAAEWSATIEGTARQPVASLELDVQQLSVGEWKGAGLRVEAGYDAGRIGIHRAQLSWADQHVEAKGELGGLSAEAPLRFAGTIEGGSIGALAKHLGMAQIEGGAVDGNIRVAGTVARPTAEVTLRTGELSIYGEHFAQTALTTTWRDGVLRLTQLSAEQTPAAGGSGRVEASGSLAVDSGQYTVEAAGTNLRLDAPLPGGQSLTGLFKLSASGEGTLADPCLTAQVTGSSVNVGNTEIGAVTVNVEAGNHLGAIRLTAPELHAEVTSTVAMQGAWPFELKLDARDTRLGTNPEISFDANASAKGSLAEPRVDSASVRVQNLRIATPQQEAVGEGPAELSFEDGRMHIGRLALKSGASVLRLSGEMPLEEGAAPGSITAQGNFDLESISRWMPLPDSLHVAGVAELNAKLSGSLRSWQPTGSLTLQQGRVDGPPLPIRIENIAGRLDLENGILGASEITGNAGTGTLKMGGSIPLGMLSTLFPEPRGGVKPPARFSAQLDNLNLSRGTGEKSITATIGAKLEGETPALSLDALRATVELTRLEATTSRGDLKQATPARIQIADGSARLEKFEVKGNDSALKMSGVLGLTAELPIQLEATGQADLSILSILAPPLEVAGIAELDFQVGGTLANPQSKGSVRVDNASLSLPNPPVQAGNIKLHASMEGQHFTLKELSGTLNGGTFSGGGDLKLDRQGIHDANLTLTAKDTFVEFPAAVKTTSSLDLKLVSRDDGLLLQGQVEVQEGYYEASVDLFSGSSNLGFAPSGTPDAGAIPISFDVGIVTKRPVEMDNNLGRIAGSAKLRLAGTTDQPRLLGAVELEEDGRLYFGDRTYYIERGVIRFPGASRNKPELNIQAYTRTNDYTIRLGLTGSIDEVTTTFTSDPPLSRDDVIAVLLTGKTVAENHGVDLRALEATSLATGALNATLSSQLNRSIGVSRVSIQPGAIAAESNPGARITITQDFTRSMRLIYSMNLSDSNDQIWVGEYDISRHFTTRAVKESDNSYRSEFRHDIRFGSSNPSTAAAIGATGNRRVSSVQFTGGDPLSAQDLAKAFKVKAGQKYQAAKVRKGAERVSKALMKKGYLESRVHLDREDGGLGIGITVRIERGPIVEMAYRGSGLPKKQKSRVRTAWHSGFSDQQRPKSAKNVLLAHFVKKGYLRADADARISSQDGRKLVTFDLEPGSKYHKVQIVFEGAETHRARELSEMLRQRELALAVYRDPPRVVEAVTAFYQKRGYLAATVDRPRQELDDQRRTGQVVIHVKEGPVFRVGVLHFSGNQAMSADELRAGLSLEAGAVFEPARLEPALAALKLKYGKLGYREAKIEYAIGRQNDSALVDVSFAIAENQQTSIGAIRVEGNRHTSVKFARSQLKVKEGEVANTALVRESVKNLSQTGAYGSADIHVLSPAESGATDKNINVADLVVAVNEPKPFRLLYGGLYDTGSGPGFIADFQNHNLLGDGRILGLRIRKDSDTDEARLYVTKPFWRQKRLSTTFATYFTRQTQYHQSTPTETAGVSIQQDLQLRSKWLMSYGYRFERQRGFIPDPAAPDIPEEIVSVAPMTFTISRDSRDSFLDATRGSFVSHGIEFAPKLLGSDYPYLRYYLQFSRYFALTQPRPVPFGEQARRSRLIFATAFRAGLQRGFNSTGAVLTDRFYAGGGTTVRGFKQDELGPKLANGEPAGGNAVLVLNEELRYPLFWIFDAVSFIDIGNVYPRVSDFRIKDLRSAGGFGLRIRNPFVVLRFDYGFKFNRRPGETMGAFFFSIGQAF